MNAHAEITATAEVLMRSRVKVDGIKLRGKMSSQELVNAIVSPIENDENQVYAVRIAVPTHIKGAVDIQSFNRAGKKLENRRYHIQTMPDGESYSLCFHTEKKEWAFGGLFKSKSLADTIGVLWTSGVLEIDFAK